MLSSKTNTKDDEEEEEEEDENEYTHIVRLVQSPIGFTKGHYQNAIGLRTDDEIDKKKELFGANIFDLPMPTFLDLFKKQLVSPIV